MGGGESGEEKEYGTGVEIFEDDVGEVAGESERDSREDVLEERKQDAWVEKCKGSLLGCFL